MSHTEDLLAWFDREVDTEGPDEELDGRSLGLPDTTEGDIGSILFNRLKAIFSSASDINDLVWTDRGQFDFNTTLKSEQEIRARFREAFRRAL